MYIFIYFYYRHFCFLFLFVLKVECFAIDQAELDEDNHLETSKFLLTPEDPERSVDPETQARLEALLEAAGIGKLSSGDGKHLADHEVLRRLTSSVSCALDEAAAALTRMRNDNPRIQNDKRSLVEACTDGDVGTVRKLLTEGRSVHETTEEGESILSLACSAGYYELAQVCLLTCEILKIIVYLVHYSSIIEGHTTHSATFSFLRSYPLHDLLRHREIATGTVLTSCRIDFTMNKLKTKLPLRESKNFYFRRKKYIYGKRSQMSWSVYQEKVT